VARDRGIGLLHAKKLELLGDLRVDRLVGRDGKARKPPKFRLHVKSGNSCCGFSAK
jgi:hypothetical protein